MEGLSVKSLLVFDAAAVELYQLGVAGLGTLILPRCCLLLLGAGYRTGFLRLVGALTLIASANAIGAPSQSNGHCSLKTGMLALGGGVVIVIDFIS